MKNKKLKRLTLTCLLAASCAGANAQSIPVVGDLLGGLTGGTNGGLNGIPVLGDLLGGGTGFLLNQGFLILPPLGDPSAALGNYQSIIESVLFVASGPQPFVDAITSGLAGSIVTVLPVVAGNPAGLLEFVLDGGTLITPSNALVPPIPILNAPLGLGGL